MSQIIPNIVRAWNEQITIPTYPVGIPDKNPMFLEKRVYQGSSGVVYPHPVIDKVADEKIDKTYQAVFLENQYLKIMLLPELGGRVQMALDKTNDYHFVYYNRVIKPALVGLAGPWISGGIEFNWPQHHRPSTFDPVDYQIVENADGSQTVWMGEIERMFQTKGMAGFTLYPDKAYLEISGQLYNRTPIPQTFLWWANPAVAVDEQYQSVFPPDVNAVYDHGKRDVSSFPVATGTYYKVDYAPGTDISWYRNIPVPTSYMAVNSVFDFVGGYHHGRQAGLLHVADHNVSPGKKQWTWGNGAFGQAWDRQLTDEDGPYFELMTGVFTDNQPDFGWIMPGETRQFKQYFMPYKQIGYVKNATIDALLNLDIIGSKATVSVYVTAYQPAVTVLLRLGTDVLLQETVELSPTITYTQSVSLPADYCATDLTALVHDHSGRTLVQYTPVDRQQDAVPDPARPMDEPERMPTSEALYLAGMHLEQYRHATYSPTTYYEEALRRDPSDSRANQALGLWYFRKGQFGRAETHLRRAVEALTAYNPNPYSGESHYYLGLTLVYQHRYNEAHPLFHKACWNAAWQDTSFFQLARLSARQAHYERALEEVEQALRRNTHCLQANHLKTALLRRLKQFFHAETVARATRRIDPLDAGALFELVLIANETGNQQEADTHSTELQRLLRGNVQSYLEIAIDYGQAGLMSEAVALLSILSPSATDPLLYYYLAYYSAQQGDESAATAWAQRGADCPTDWVFPNRLTDIAVLQAAIQRQPTDYKAWYYLGNLWYDKRQYTQAITAWENARQQVDKFPTVHRNLGLAYFNCLNLPDSALQAYETAFALDDTDARVLYELDQLRKRLNYPTDRRLAALEAYPNLVAQRDDLYVEWVMLYNLCGQPARALSLLASRQFHPWEGGEGKVSGQYVQANIALARQALETEAYFEAIEYLKQAMSYPENLGEGKLFGAQENDIMFLLGEAYQGVGNIDQANACWEVASTGSAEPAPALFYNDQRPETIFYQGLALQRLNRSVEAQMRFKNLIDYGATHLNDVVKLDYFAVSLPDLLIFNDDLSHRNHIHCHYLQGLGYLGLEQFTAAIEHLDNVLRLDQSHQGAVVHRTLLELSQTL